MSRHLSTRNTSSKSMHTFLSILANRQTDKQTNMGKNMLEVKNKNTKIMKTSKIQQHQKFIMETINKWNVLA